MCRASHAHCHRIDLAELKLAALLTNRGTATEFEVRQSGGWAERFSQKVANDFREW